MTEHEKFMLRCIELAQNAAGQVAPNPMVGAVVVHHGQIIAEGYHRAYGSPHAEVEAIKRVENKSILQECTLYVNLEPCNHFGKTPPCTELIIRSKIPKLVIATTDPFEQVNGTGISRLQEAGIQVTTGILAEQARYLNRRFFVYHEQQRPYIILKWAETSDGFIDKHRQGTQSPALISNHAAHILSHRWRTQEQAILVGANTVLLDNPSLTARLWAGKNPIRIVLDKRNNLPNHLRVFDNQASTLKIHTSDIRACINKLYHENIQSVIIEGGSKTLQQFIDAKLWDEARIFIAPKTFETGVAAPQIAAKLYETIKIGDNLLKIMTP
ncbi:MAG: bifunctional diaminohydroxyphosphoribosylaminopyrimidine deaminase/5-amino-6-(5-phosphoribosylamino)uracil reductase RibD [Bacteroidales bacterium]